MTTELTPPVTAADTAPTADTVTSDSGGAKKRNNRRKPKPKVAADPEASTAATAEGTTIATVGDDANKTISVETVGNKDDIAKKQARRHRRGGGRPAKPTSGNEKVVDETTDGAATDDTMDIDQTETTVEAKKQIPRRRHPRKKVANAVTVVTSTKEDETTEVPSDEPGMTDQPPPLDSPSPKTIAASNQRQKRRGKRTAAVAPVVDPSEEAAPADKNPPSVPRRRRRGGGSSATGKTTDASGVASPKKRAPRGFIRTKLFDVWNTDQAKVLRSNGNEGGPTVRVSFRNSTSVSDVVLCWVDAHGVSQKYNLPNEEDRVVHVVECGTIVSFAVCQAEDTTDMILAAYRPRTPTTDVQVVYLVESNKPVVDGTAAPVYTVQGKSVPVADDVSSWTIL